jgi:hypothetical protein
VDHLRPLSSRRDVLKAVSLRNPMFISSSRRAQAPALHVGSAPTGIPAGGSTSKKHDGSGRRRFWPCTTVAARQASRGSAARRPRAGNSGPLLPGRRPLGALGGAVRGRCPHPSPGFRQPSSRHARQPPAASSLIGDSYEVENESSRAKGAGRRAEPPGPRDTNASSSCCHRRARGTLAACTN